MSATPATPRDGYLAAVHAFLTKFAALLEEPIASDKSHSDHLDAALAHISIIESG